MINSEIKTQVIIIFINLIQSETWKYFAVDTLFETFFKNFDDKKIGEAEAMIYFIKELI